MTNIDIVKELLRQAYQSESETDIRKLLGACIAIMDVTFEDEKPQSEPSADTDPQEPAEKAPDEGTKKPGRRPLDTGKLKALREAGWPVAKIANEMGVTEQTIRNYITKLRI